jgi:putative Holliday junction resolvase
MRCMALDIGNRRTGVAVGEVLARPLVTLKRRSKIEDFGAIADLVREHQVEMIIVGLPLNMDGSAGFQAQRVMRYADKIKAALNEMGIEVGLTYWDERLTTREAEQAMIAGGRSRHDRRERVDAVAAAVILQGYLEHLFDGEKGQLEA